MAALHFSPDYRYLCSPDGKEDAHVIFKPGKNRDGYFDNEDILAQATVLDLSNSGFSISQALHHRTRVDSGNQ